MDGSNNKPKSETSTLLTPKIEPGVVPTQKRVTSFSTRPNALRSLNGSTSTGNKYINKYKPNVNAKREKTESLTVGRSNRAYNGGRGKDSKRGGRGRGRGDQKNNVVQGLTPWSSGISDTSRSGRSFSGGRGGGSGGGRGGYGGGGGGGLVRASSSRVKSEEEYKMPVMTDDQFLVDAENDDEVMKMLADGDFIDYGENDNAEYYNQFVQPITLAQYKAPPSETEVKLQLETPESVKKKIPEENGVQAAEEGKVVENGGPKPEVKTEEKKIAPPSRASLADSLGKEGAFFVQLPNPLPFKADTSSRPSKDSKQSSKAYTQESEFCHLKDLKPGKIGTVKVFKSGRAFLCLGSYSLPISLLKQPNHVMEVAHVDVSDNSGKVSILSQIDNRLIVSPDFESLVNSASRKA